MKLLLALVAALLCASCATDAQILRIKGDAYMDGWKAAVNQGARI